MKTFPVNPFSTCALALFLFIDMPGAQAQFVDLTADIQTVSWLHGWTNKPPSVEVQNWTTHCVVGSSSWLIEGDLGTTRQAWLFTGSNIIAHSVLTALPSERKELFARNHPEYMLGKGYTTVTKPSDGQPAAQPALTAGTPLSAEAFFNLPWLAFCSGPYLQHGGRQVPLPVRDSWTYWIPHSDHVAGFDDTLGLPKTVDAFLVNQPPALPQTTAQPVCQYRVLESTNVLGWNFPLEFHLAQYRRDYGSGVWELHLTASGKVTSLGIGSAPCIPTEAQKLVEK